MLPFKLTIQPTLTTFHRRKSLKGLLLSSTVGAAILTEGAALVSSDRSLPSLAEPYLQAIAYKFISRDMLTIIRTAQ